MNIEIWSAISRDLFHLDPLFGSINPLFSYRSLPLRPYKTSKIATVTLATRILLLITAIHTHVVLLLQAAAKVLQCLLMLYLKTQETARFITSQLLEGLSSPSIYGSSNVDYR